MRHFLAAALILLLIPIGFMAVAAFTPVFLGIIAAVVIAAVIGVFLISGGAALGGSKGIKDAVQVTKWIGLILNRRFHLVALLRYDGGRYPVNVAFPPIV